MAKGSLGLIVGGPDEEYDPSMYDDAAMADDGDGMDDEGDGGDAAFEAYADTVFNVEASPEERTDALRQAILSIVEGSSTA